MLKYELIGQQSSGIIPVITFYGIIPFLLTIQKPTGLFPLQSAW